MHLFLTPFKVHAGIQCCGRNLCDHPHPCPIYIFKTPNGVCVPKPDFLRALSLGTRAQVIHACAQTLISSSVVLGHACPSDTMCVPKPYFLRALCLGTRAQAIHACAQILISSSAVLGHIHACAQILISCGEKHMDEFC